ncbi:MAG: NAD(P)-dependent oxidoreductase [Desulfobacterales bacterium]|nr:NAD(P)-dependent oxidoreductase [Desulfobacterales bacterium]
MNKIVVFGGAGFIASHLADKLDKMNYEVILYDKEESPYCQGNQKMVVGDILDDNLVKKALENANYVYHFAGIADIEQSTHMPLETIRVNVLGTAHILEACVKAKVHRFIFASSMYVYSELGSFYRVSKQACEKLIEEYSRQFDLKYTILRLGSVYGPRANYFNPIKKIIDQLRENKKVICNRHPDDVREYIHVLDMAEECINILDKRYENQHIIINGSQPLTMDKLLQMLREIIGNNAEIEYVPNEAPSHYQISPYAFRPKTAIKIIPTHFHDLGQGLLDLFYLENETV